MIPMPPKEKKSRPDTLKPVDKHKSGTSERTETNGAKQPEITGLCVNCDKRLSCRHCRQLGGVWYCEEYE